MKSFRWTRYPLAATFVLMVMLAHADAPVGRYIVANGTVTDMKTHLVWQQRDDGMTRTWDSAGTYCAGLSLDGEGWRLPTIKELQTIVDYSKTNPSIDSRFTGTGST
jgi:hypothetical protein